MQVLFSAAMIVLVPVLDSWPQIVHVFCFCNFLIFGIEDFTDPGQMRLTLTGLSLWVCLHKCCFLAMLA